MSLYQRSSKIGADFIALSVQEKFFSVFSIASSVQENFFLLFSIASSVQENLFSVFSIASSEQENFFGVFYRFIGEKNSAQQNCIALFDFFQKLFIGIASIDTFLSIAAHLCIMGETE